MPSATPPSATSGAPRGSGAAIGTGGANGNGGTTGTGGIGGPSAISGAPAGTGTIPGPGTTIGIPAMSVSGAAHGAAAAPPAATGPPAAGAPASPACPYMHAPPPVIYGTAAASGLNAMAAPHNPALATTPMLNRSKIVINVPTPSFAQQNHIAVAKSPLDDRPHCWWVTRDTPRAAPRCFQMVTSRRRHKSVARILRCAKGISAAQCVICRRVQACTSKASVRIATRGSPKHEVFVVNTPAAG